MHILLARSRFDTQQVAGDLVTKATSLTRSSTDELSILAQLLNRPELESRSAAQWRALHFPDQSGFPICADLLGLQAGLDTVTVGAPILDIAGDDVKAINSSIQDVFSDSGWTLRLSSNGQGLLFSEQEMQGHNQASHRLADKNLRDFSVLKGALQTLDAELQMLLFDHAVNLRRAEQGRSPISGLWFWNSVPASSSGSSSEGQLPVLFSRDSTLVSAWAQGSGQIHPEASIEKLMCPNWVVVLDSMATQQAVLSYLASGPVRPCYFVDRHGLCFELRSPSMLRRLSRRFRA